MVTGRVFTPDDAPQLIGSAPPWLAALEHASAAAALDRPILIVGERGSGKELVAARVHFLSPRWNSDYLKVNCAALSEELLDSELFGHEPGAFTGAQKRHIGRFERGDGGTLFLDEIASASLRAQEKILRVIEYGEFERVGGDRVLATDVRVVAAANVDLPRRAAQGDFRADLLDRLAFDVVTLPPLRARREDIPLLADHFGRRMAATLGAEQFAGFSPEALDQLLAHPWPGNVRELKNVAERAAYRAIAADSSGATPIMAVTLDPFESPWRPGATVHNTPRADGSGPNAADHAPQSEPAAAMEPEHRGPRGPSAHASERHPAPPSDPTASFTTRVAELEIRLLEDALSACGGHQGRAAERLGLTYHQFRGLMRKHSLPSARAAPPSGSPSRTG